MKVLIAHARYIEPGGEEAVIDAQHAALEALGLEVVRYECDNSGLDASPVAKARAGASAVWSRRSARAISDVITQERPDVLHVHNNFQVLSPSIYGAAKRHNVAVVQHLHNARLACINVFFERAGAACTECVGTAASWPGVAHRCYRGSLGESVAATAVQLTHRALGSHRRNVDLFIAVSGALGDALTGAKVVPRDRVRVVHNGIADPGARAAGSDRGYALFTGRLSEEKGVQVLLDAAAALPEVPVRIAGDGPLRAGFEGQAARRGLRHVRFLGRLSREALLDELRGARVCVAPSIGFDPLPTSVIEACAVGVPVIGSRTGGIPEIIDEVLVPPGDVVALTAALRAAHEQPDRFAALGHAARSRYESHFTADAFGRALVAAYAAVTGGSA